MAREVWCDPCVTGRGSEGGHRTDHAQGTGRRSLWLRRALHLTTATKAMWCARTRTQQRKHVRMSAGPRLIDAPAPIATPSCSGTRCALRLAQTGPEEVSVRRNSWPRSRPHWCVRDCDAVSQQDLEEETGCGQADCSI